MYIWPYSHSTHTRKHAHTHIRAHAHTHIRTHAQTRKHTHILSVSLTHVWEITLQGDRRQSPCKRADLQYLASPCRSFSVSETLATLAEFQFAFACTPWFAAQWARCENWQISFRIGGHSFLTHPILTHPFWRSHSFLMRSNRDRFTTPLRTARLARAMDA